MTWTDPEEAQSLGLWLNWLGIGSCTCPYAFQQLGKLYGVSMGPGWVRLKTTPGCGEHDEKKPKDTEMATTPGTPGTLCVATYDEPQRKDRADTHTCNLDDGHTGPHYCDLCGSWWTARVGVVPDPHPRRDRDQIALARMDASLLGTGWLMVTRDEDEGTYGYRRIDPVRVSVGGRGEGESEEDLEATVRRTAARTLATMRFAEKLTLLIRRAEMRKDQMRGWIAVGPLKDLLLGLEANGGNGGSSADSADSAKKP